MTTSTSILLSRRVGSLSLSLVISCGISSENRWSHCAFFSSSSSSKDNKGGGDEGKDPFQWINKQINELKNTDTNALAIKATQLINSESTVQVSYGFLVGYGSGFIMKRITRGAALLMGGLFVLAQVGADYGYITIDHDKIKKDVEKKLDINQDEKPDKQGNINVQKIAEKVMKVLSNNMPANSGFAVGAIMGWRGVGLT